MMWDGDVIKSWPSPTREKLMQIYTSCKVIPNISSDSLNTKGGYFWDEHALSRRLLNDYINSYSNYIKIRVTFYFA